MGNFRERRKKIKQLPLKDRPGWQVFRNILPAITSAISFIVPGGGVIKSVIDGIIDDVEIADPAKKIALDFLVPIAEEEIQIDNEDIQQARQAEIQRMESPDWLVRNVVPIIALTWTAFSMVLFVLILTHKVMVNDNIAFLIINTVGNILMLIIGYYFGSTASSKQKDKTIQQMSEK